MFQSQVLVILAATADVDLRFAWDLFGGWDQRVELADLRAALYCLSEPKQKKENPSTSLRRELCKQLGNIIADQGYQVGDLVGAIGFFESLYNQINREFCGATDGKLLFYLQVRQMLEREILELKMAAVALDTFGH